LQRRGSVGGGEDAPALVLEDARHRFEVGVVVVDDEKGGGRHRVRRSVPQSEWNPPDGGLPEGRLCAEGQRTRVAGAYSRGRPAVVFFPERRVPCESAAATSSPERRSMFRLVTIAVFLALVLALACDSGPPGPGQVRFANLIPDAPSAI